MVNLDVTSPQLKAIKVWADAHASRNLNEAEPILSKDFVLKTFPTVAKLPDLTKERYLQKYGILFTLLARVEVVFHEVIEAPGKVVIHLTLLFTTANGTMFDCDSAAIFSFVDEDGELKVVEAKDFSDPEKRGAFHAEAEKILAKAMNIV